MTPVIIGLVAVVLLVLIVVALGMRSMNRRESALSSERLKAMAENKGPKPRRPAEETFFESFPAGFDAFEEPEEKATTKRSGAARPAPRPGGRQAARPTQRGGKQPAAARGRRGVDEWGEPDDYDDDYWSRVRNDEGGFGGTIAARMATPRPLAQTAGASGNSSAGSSSRPSGGASGKQAARATDADAVTVQAPLPQRPVTAGLAGLVEPSRPTPASAAADHKTVTFSAPTPDVLGALGSPSTGPLASPSTGPFEPRSAGSTGSRSTRPASRRSGSTSRSGSASGSGPADAGASRTTGSFEAVRGTGPFDAMPSSPPATGSFGGSFDTGRTSGSFEAVRGTGPFEATRSPMPAADPLAAPPAAAGRQGTGSFDAWGGAYDVSPGSTGPFSAADTGPSYAVTPPPPASSAPPAAAEPGWSPAGGYPPPTPASTASPGWPGIRDVLDDPEPPRSASSWPSNETYQAPTYDGYSTSYSSESAYGPTPSSSPSPASSPSSSSYEVSAGWASIDDSDTVTGGSPSTGVPTGPSRAVSPYESAGYDVPSGQSYYGYEQQQPPGTGQPPSWPEQNTGGSWPSYDELYGNASEESTAARHGSHRNPETDYPDYYR